MKDQGSYAACRQVIEERQDALTHELQSLEADRSLLRQYRDTDTVLDPRAGEGAQVERARSATSFTCLPAALFPALAVPCQYWLPLQDMSLHVKVCNHCDVNSMQIQRIELAQHTISSSVTATPACMYLAAWLLFGANRAANIPSAVQIRDSQTGR